MARFVLMVSICLGCLLNYQAAAQPPTSRTDDLIILLRPADARDEPASLPINLADCISIKDALVGDLQTAFPALQLLQHYCARFESDYAIIMTPKDASSSMPVNIVPRVSTRELALGDFYTYVINVAVTEMRTYNALRLNDLGMLEETSRNYTVTRLVDEARTGTVAGVSQFNQETLLRIAPSLFYQRSTIPSSIKYHRTFAFEAANRIILVHIALEDLSDIQVDTRCDLQF